MDRGAVLTSPLNPADAVPPYTEGFVRKTGLVGVGLAATAALLGLVASGMGESAPGIVNTARLFLVFIGVVVTGTAVSMRPELWWTWGFGTIACLLAVVGLPDNWDSFQMFFTVIAGVAATGVAFCRFSPRWRYIGASAILLFHFTGIFMATTAPPSTPWLNEQIFRRVYNPYLQFLYLRNAYHFYSPDPGPASVMAFLLKTETGKDPVAGKKEYTTKWVVMPKRPENVRDPLGLGYYRLLSLNEQTARGSAGLATPNDQFEKTEMSIRRNAQLSRIPMHPAEPQLTQYRLLNPEVARYVVPSYASHVIVWNTKDKEEAARTTVKIYRMQHMNLTPDRLAKSDPPYHPGTYRPFFLGEFDAFGKMIDPRDPFLYWMIPIIPWQKPPLPNSPSNPFSKDYYDYLSVHALDMTLEDVLREDEKAGRVFNWSQLR